jgi:hypothetical protein
MWCLEKDYVTWNNMNIRQKPQRYTKDTREDDDVSRRKNAGVFDGHPCVFDEHSWYWWVSTGILDIGVAPCNNDG